MHFSHLQQVDPTTGRTRPTTVDLVVFRISFHRLTPRSAWPISNHARLVDAVSAKHLGGTFLPRTCSELALAGLRGEDPRPRAHDVAIIDGLDRDNVRLLSEAPVHAVTLRTDQLQTSRRRCSTVCRPANTGHLRPDHRHRVSANRRLLSWSSLPQGLNGFPKPTCETTGPICSYDIT